jgi:pyruvate dehydrogenase E1 component alpha subunit
MTDVPNELAPRKAAMTSASSTLRSHHMDLLRQMILIRRFEEKCAELYTQQKIRGFLHLYIGEEAVGVGVISSLRDDAIVSTYREHGHALARGMSPGSVMAEMFGKQEGCSRGRGGSMHLFDAKLRFYGGNAVVGGGLPVAVGLALADKMRSQPRVTCCFFGDGAVAEGEFHESMNLAALWKLPLLFVCENNRYAMGTRLDFSHSFTDLSKKAAAYGVPAMAVDGMDVLAVEDAAKTGTEYVRSGEGPYFLECRTYRFRAHSMYDPELYREKAEVEEWKKRDPIPALIRRIENDGRTADPDVAEIERTVAKDIDEAIAFADSGTWEPVEDLLRFVYSERPA